MICNDKSYKMQHAQNEWAGSYFSGSGPKADKRAMIPMYNTVITPLVIQLCELS